MTNSPYRLVIDHCQLALAVKFTGFGRGSDFARDQTDISLSLIFLCMSARGPGIPLPLPLQEQVSVVCDQSAAPLDAGVAGQLELKGCDDGL